MLKRVNIYIERATSSDIKRAIKREMEYWLKACATNLKGSYPAGCEISHSPFESEVLIRQSVQPNEIARSKVQRRHTVWAMQVHN